MKNKKLKAGILTAIMVLIAILIMPNAVKAQSRTVSLHLSRKEIRRSSQPVNNMGFSIGDPKGNSDVLSEKTASIIWKFVKHPQANDVSYDDTINMYCVKADVGFKTENTEEYTNSFDFIEDRVEMQGKTQDQNLQSIVKAEADDTYYGIIALADLIYVKGTLAPDGTTSQNVSTESDKRKLQKI